jgi:hypothetical protein
MLKNREALMKRFLAISTILLVFYLASACTDDSIIPATGNDDPTMQPLMKTLTVIASTVEAIGQTATAYSFTPTPSSTPTKIPDSTALRNLLSDTINGELIAVLGAKIAVVDVSYGPRGAQVFTELYIEMNCESQNHSVCPSPQVVTAVIDSCKENKKKVKANVPTTTQLLVITIYDPGHATQVVEADWPNVTAYLDGDIPAEIFSQRLRYTQY